MCGCKPTTAPISANGNRYPILIFHDSFPRLCRLWLCLGSARGGESQISCRKKGSTPGFHDGFFFFSPVSFVGERGEGGSNCFDFASKSRLWGSKNDVIIAIEIFQMKRPPPLFFFLCTARSGFWNCVFWKSGCGRGGGVEKGREHGQEEVVCGSRW